MKQYLYATVLLGALAALIVWGVGAVLASSAATPSPTLEWEFIPAAVPERAPFAAWYDVSALPPGGAAWLQLRVCSEPDRCVLGARKGLSEGGGTGLVTVTRDLAVGAYSVDLLLVRRDVFGVARTVESVTAGVGYGVAPDPAGGLAPPDVAVAPGAAATCAAPSIVVGSGQVRADAVAAYTNALVFVPQCDVVRTALLSGTEVKGVGPAVTVTAEALGEPVGLTERGMPARGLDRNGIVVWNGFVVAGETAVLHVPEGVSWWVSFTNDLATGSEDRNLTITLVPAGSDDAFGPAGGARGGR